jgi:bile acid:Na+ symporter, BASS family
MTNPSRNTPRFLGWLSLLLAAMAIVGLFLPAAAKAEHPVFHRFFAGALAVGSLVFFALYCMGHPFLKRFVFTVWVFAFVAASMVYPGAFMAWGGFELKLLIVPLIQVIMFGMGTTLSLADFARVFKMPRPVLAGLVLQFSVMPLVGFVVASLLGFPPEIAAGIILIGSCPGGVASNLMAYLANGDVALSVTMTSCSTLVSPVMTPFLMDKLAGQLIEVEFLKMMFEIVNMIIVPIIAGLVANRVLYSRRSWAGRRGLLLLISVIGMGVAVLMVSFQEYLPGSIRTFRNGIVIGAVLISVVALAKLVVGILRGGSTNWMDKVLPIVSMAGICFIIAIITARSRQDLLSVGALLIVAVIIHNFTGYVLGYWLSRLLRLDERTCRTVSIEVGLQNGGMASALAMGLFDSTKAALAPAIFGPWMNVSGSVLATWWHRKPVRTAEGIAYPISETPQKGALDGTT